MKKKTNEKRPMELILQLMIAVVLILCLVGLTELYFNHNVMRLPKGQKGVHEIPMDSMEYSGYELRADGFYRNAQKEDSSLIRMNLEGKYVDKLSYSYEYKGLLDTRVDVVYLNAYGAEERMTLWDKNTGVMRKSTMKIGKNVKTIEIFTDDPLLREEGIGYLDLDSMDLIFTNFSIVNNIQLNPYRIIAIVLAGILAAALVIFHGFFFKRMHLVFFLIALCVGSLMIMVMPASKTGWDEEMHFERSYRLSLYPGAQNVTEEIPWFFVCGIDTWPLSLPQTLEEKEAVDAYMDQACQYETGSTLLEGSTCSIYTSGYVASAIAIKVGRFLKLPFHIIFAMGRFGNLLMYAIVMALAIWLLPTGKRLLMMIGLMPTSLFMAACYSYDPTVIAFTSLGTAILLREIFKKEKGSFSLPLYIFAMLCFLWGMFPKAVYAPMALSAFAIPADNFKSKKQKWLVRAIAVVTFLILMSSFVLPTILNPSSHGDTRGGAVDVGMQMKNIFRHPIGFIGILVKNIWVVFSPYILTTQIFNFMGHWGGAEYFNVALIIAIIAFVMEGTWNKEHQMSLLSKFWILFGSAGAIVLIWTAFYLTFTEVGKTLIGGVQARYFLPMLFPLLLILKTDKIQVQISENAKNMIMTALSAGYIYVVFFLQMLVLRCC